MGPLGSDRADRAVAAWVVNVRGAARGVGSVAVAPVAPSDAVRGRVARTLEKRDGGRRRGHRAAGGGVDRTHPGGARRGTGWRICRERSGDLRPGERGVPEPDRRPHYGALWDRIERQGFVLEAPAVAAGPPLAVRTLSMGLAGAEIEQHRHFAATIEAYRRDRPGSSGAGWIDCVSVCRRRLGTWDEAVRVAAISVAEPACPFEPVASGRACGLYGMAGRRRGLTRSLRLDSSGGPGRASRRGSPEHRDRITPSRHHDPGPMAAPMCFRPADLTPCKVPAGP